jgi:hypothetical protein
MLKVESRIKEIFKLANSFEEKRKKMTSQEIMQETAKNLCLPYLEILENQKADLIKQAINFEATASFPAFYIDFDKRIIVTDLNGENNEIHFSSSSLPRIDNIPVIILNKIQNLCSKSPDYDNNQKSKEQQLRSFVTQLFKRFENYKDYFSEDSNLAFALKQDKKGGVASPEFVNLVYEDIRLITTKNPNSILLQFLEKAELLKNLTQNPHLYLLPNLEKLNQTQEKIEKPQEQKLIPNSKANLESVIPLETKTLTEVNVEKYYYDESNYQKSISEYLSNAINDKNAEIQFPQIKKPNGKLAKEFFHNFKQYFLPTFKSKEQDENNVLNTNNIGIKTIPFLENDVEIPNTYRTTFEIVLDAYNGTKLMFCVINGERNYITVQVTHCKNPNLTEIIQLESIKIPSFILQKDLRKELQKQSIDNPIVQKLWELEKTKWKETRDPIYQELDPNEYDLLDEKEKLNWKYTPSSSTSRMEYSSNSGVREVIFDETSAFYSKVIDWSDPYLGKPNNTTKIELFITDKNNQKIPNPNLEQELDKQIRNALSYHYPFAEGSFLLNAGIFTENFSTAFEWLDQNEIQVFKQIQPTITQIEEKHKENRKLADEKLQEETERYQESQKQANQKVTEFFEEFGGFRIDKNGICRTDFILIKARNNVRNFCFIKNQNDQITLVEKINGMANNSYKIVKGYKETDFSINLQNLKNNPEILQKYKEAFDNYLENLRNIYR